MIVDHAKITGRTGAPRARQVLRLLKHPPRWLDLVAPCVMIGAILGLWQLIARIVQYGDLILPGPGTVFQRFWEATSDGTLPTNAAVTLEEAGLGFAVAAIIAFPLGYLFAHVPLLERLFAPLLAASQAVPSVAIAPLLILWLGNGTQPKVVVCAVVVVFPLLVSTVTGIRGVAREYYEVAQVFGAPWWELVLRVELPLAAPTLLAGVKLGLTLSLIGALVGEFVASDSGLGFLLNLTRSNYDTPLLFADLLTLGAIGIALYSFVSFLERIVSRWQG